MHNTLLQTFEWFESARPEPSSKDFHSQIGVHFEEVAEMLEVITPSGEETSILIQDAYLAVKKLAEHLKATDNVISIEPEDNIDFLDSLCDQVVTATGVAYVSDYKFIEAMDEVNRSNYSKFGEDGLPIFNENKKVIKGPQYTKPDLTRFI